MQNIFEFGEDLNPPPRPWQWQFFVKNQQIAIFASKAVTKRVGMRFFVINQFKFDAPWWKIAFGHREISSREVLSLQSDDFGHFSLDYVNQPEFNLGLNFSNILGFFGRTNIKYNRKIQNLSFTPGFGSRRAQKAGTFLQKMSQLGFL
jgi:hypothetical protein